MAGQNRSDEFALGLLEGKVTAMEKTLGKVEQDQTRIFQKLDEMGGVQAKILAKLDSFNSQCLTCRNDLEGIKRDIGTDTLVRKIKEREATAAHPVVASADEEDGGKPWNKPIGVILFDVLMKALNIVLVGGVVAVILYGVGNAKL